MRKSPTIDVRQHELDHAEGNKLAYIAQLYKGTVPVWPATVIGITGNTWVGGLAADRLYNKMPGNFVVKVELYGSIFKKFQEDGVIKNGIEAGLVLSIPFN